jgi:uracil-DNA glycosylase family 4
VTTLQEIHDAIAACERCPRLRRYCARVAAEKKAAHRDETYWGRPVPGFGDPDARLVVVGLAPAAHGANRTGRVFTGDGSGDFLMRALFEAGFANQPTSRHAADGLRLRDVYITAAVRCAPPDNRPTPAEIRRCRPHLLRELQALPRAQVLLALGRIGFDACLSVLANREAATGPRPAFRHGLVHRFGAAVPILVASYHPSRQNTNTGRLTPAMLASVFATARKLIEVADTHGCAIRR